MRKIIFTLSLGLLFSSCGTEESVDPASIPNAESSQNQSMGSVDTSKAHAAEVQAKGIDSSSALDSSVQDFQVFDAEKLKKKGLKKKHYVANENLRTEAYKFEKGWGYKIYEDEKLVLDQKVIPGLDVEGYFISEKEATRVARLHVYKMQQGSMPMEILMQDLKNLSITF